MTVGTQNSLKRVLERSVYGDDVKKEPCVPGWSGTEDSERMVRHKAEYSGGRVGHGCAHQRGRGSSLQI